MNKLIIYLANLTHVNNDIGATEPIPLNIGYLAAYAKQEFNENIQIRIFNLVSELDKAISERVPDILGVSNYSWNGYLAHHSLSYFRRFSSRMVTVMGGPNYPNMPDKQKLFLEQHPWVDFYVFHEGEVSFSNLIRARLDHGSNISKLKNQSLPGCHYLQDGELIARTAPKRIKTLDEIPSPYLLGYFDQFLEAGFTPMVQSNRGCPYSCTFCAEGIQYYTKISAFSSARVISEIDYIAPRVKSGSVQITDSNFGMYRQDYEICKAFRRSREEYRWPIFISATTGKSQKERVVECITLLGNSLPFSLSLQSTDPEVLQNIKRRNLPMDALRSIQKEVEKREGESLSELIIPLPGETYQSHLKGIQMLMEAKVEHIDPYTTMMLPGTPLYESTDSDSHEMLIKYRVIPRDFGIYHGSNVVEIERVCVGTKDLSFSEYCDLREFHLIVYCYYNKGVFKELLHYINLFSISAMDFCEELWRQLPSAPQSIKEIFSSFLDDTRAELWDSENEILEHYENDKNFDQLVTQAEGSNLIQKYNGRFVSCFDDGLQHATDTVRSLFKKQAIPVDEELMVSFQDYIYHARGRIMNELLSDEVYEIPYDIHGWKMDGFNRSLPHYKKFVRLEVSQTEDQRSIIRTYKEIYGETDDSIGKILTRLQPSALFLHTTYCDDQNRSSIN